MKDIERISIRLYPTNEQFSYLLANCYNARFAYNWATAKFRSALNNKVLAPSAFDLAKEFNRLKRQPEYSWLRGKHISQRATKMAIVKNFKTAVDKFRKQFYRAPKFKTKRVTKMSYYTHESTTKIDVNRVRLDKIGWIASSNTHPIGDDNIIYSDPLVIFTGDYFELSVAIKYINPIRLKYSFNEINESNSPIGIDVGLVHTAVLSDGTVYDLPNLLKLDKKIAKLDKRLSKGYQRMKVQTHETKTKSSVDSGEAYMPKSKNLLKLESKRRKLYEKHVNIRKNFRCNIVADIVKKRPSAIVIEGILDPKESWKQKRNHKYNKRISDSAIGDLLNRIKTKCKWLDIPLVIADPAYPSTKRCSCCGNIIGNKLKRGRVFKCCECGYEEDRDLNAAYNLRSLAI